MALLESATILGSALVFSAVLAAHRQPPKIGPTGPQGKDGIGSSVGPTGPDGTVTGPTGQPGAPGPALPVVQTTIDDAVIFRSASGYSQIPIYSTAYTVDKLTMIVIYIIIGQDPDVSPILIESATTPFDTSLGAVGYLGSFSGISVPQGQKLVVSATKNSTNTFSLYFTGSPLPLVRSQIVTRAILNIVIVISKR